MKTVFRRVVARLLEFQTRRLMRRRTFQVVGVAGSLGKTTTKMAIATVLGQKYHVLVQPGSFNDEIGLPLACFNIELPRNIFNPFPWLGVLMKMERAIGRPYPFEVLVIEMGTDAPGEISHILSYIQPDISVVTAVAPEHMEYFGTLDAVAAEELALVAGSKRSVVNCDDVAARYRHQYLDQYPADRVAFYGLDRKADYSFAMSQTSLLDGTTGSLLKDGHVKVAGVSFGLYGQHSAKAAAAAYAVGDLMGLTTRQLEDGIQAIRPVSGRMNRLAGLNGAVIIDDTYNSSPDSAIAALEALAKAPAKRRIAIMGSMNELGAQSAHYHRIVGAVCTDLDLLITVGEMANQHLGPAALQQGLDPRFYKPADSPYAAAEFLKLILKDGDVVLAKGSQNGVFCEEVIKPVLANPADASLLVRQSPIWLRRKAAQFKDAPRP